MELEIHGKVAPGFETVLEAFKEAFADKPKMGAALSVHHDGAHVVDLWAGLSREDPDESWQEDTLGVIFSCTKGLVSILAAQLVQSGQLSYEDKVVEYWPEFGVNGKQDVTVAELLSHRAGLSAPRKWLTIDQVLNWDFMVDTLAKQEPLWEPGTGHGYHALTHGWLNGEVLRRVSGKTVGELFQENIAIPLGVDAFIGLPTELQDKGVQLTVGSSLRELTLQQEVERNPSFVDWGFRAMTLGGAFSPELVEPGLGFNSPEVREAEIPGAGGMASARALSAIWSSLIAETDGVRLLSDQMVEVSTTCQSEGEPVWDVPQPWPRYGMGFQLDSEARRYMGPRGFGHDGAGGQVSFADPDSKVGFAFITNQMEAIGDVRATRIIDALKAAIN